MWQELAKNLAVLISNYQKLIKLNEKKHGVLILVQLSELEKIVQEEEKIVAKIHQAEKDRQGIMTQLAATQPSLQPDMQMDEVCNQCPDEGHRNTLRRLHQMLSKLVKEAQEASANNEFLISAALDAVNFKLNQLGGSTVEPAYGKQGQEIVSHSNNLNLET